VSFGQASGPVPDFKVTLLSQKGSLFATWPSLVNYTKTRKEVVAAVNDLFGVGGSGKVKVSVNQISPLSELIKISRRGSPPVRPAATPEFYLRSPTLPLVKSLLVSGWSLRLVKESLPDSFD